MNGFIRDRRLFDDEPSGRIILWVACLDYTLHRGFDGRIRPHLWRSWRCLLKLISEGDVLVGDLAHHRRTLVSFLVYKCIRTFLYSAPNPGQAAVTAAPVAVFIGVTCITLAAFPLSQSLPIALLQALACGLAGAFAVNRMISKQLSHLLVQPQSSSSDSEAKEGPVPNKSGIGLLSKVAGPKGTQLELVYSVFRYMQVVSACFMSFTHGGNDVSNAIGPLTAALSILHGGTSGEVIVIPTDILAWGGFGIVAGLTMWGYRVISTIGKKITELTLTRGFAAASVVLFASKLGLPISATHTLVGAVMGVAFARGMKSVRTETVKEIVASWVVTIPVGTVLSVFFTWVLRKFLTHIL